MGLNNSKEQQFPYNSREFFQQQIDFYRWRADPLINTHICRVKFQLQQSMRDRQQLRNMLQDYERIPITQILQLASSNNDSSKGELMSFENYVCSLANLEGFLSLPEILYTIHTLLSGYEILFAKMNRIAVELSYCFVTSEGEARAWFNDNYKLNEIQQEQHAQRSRNSVIISEISLIKRILEIGQRLSNNHTEFLHFNRQFRSYMDRNILHHWTFSNSRKLINSYAYNYSINLPSNLSSALKRKEKSQSMIQSENQFQINNSRSNSKSQLQSTGDIFMKKQNFSDAVSSQKESQRHSSLRESSSKKTLQINEYNQNQSKRVSSIDSKKFQKYAKNQLSPTLSKSQLLQNQYKQQLEFKIKNMSLQTSQQLHKESNNNFRHAQEAAKESNFYESKRANISHNSYKEEVPLDKKSQLMKKTRRPDKKTTISRQVSYCQKDSSQAINNFPTVVEQPFFKVKPNNQILKQKIFSHTANNSELPTYIPQVPLSVHFSVDQIRGTHNSSTLPFEKKNSVIEEQLPTKSNFAFQCLYTGKSQYIRSHANNSHSKEVSDVSSHPRMCFTVKTLNKLLGDDDLQVHQSNGSFMSLEKSLTSEYKGVLSKMGRSVDLINLPSNHQLSAAKQASHQMNRSINC